MAVLLWSSFVHLLSLRQVIGEPAKHLGPARLSIFAFLDGFGDGVPQGELRLACLLGKCHRYQGFCWVVGAHSVVGRRDRVAFLIGKAIRVDDPLWLNDFTVDAYAPDVLAIG